MFIFAYFCRDLTEFEIGIYIWYDVEILKNGSVLLKKSCQIVLNLIISVYFAKCRNMIFMS